MRTLFLTNITLLLLSLSTISIAATEEAIFAGGCFWCVESDFEKLDGVIKAESGYTGGHTPKPTYKEVSHTETGHYEAVKVTYDSDKVSYKELVDQFWYTIDPTDAIGQFCDKGNSYRSAIFYKNEEQKLIIENSKSELEKTKPFDDAIVTGILAEATFYNAEKYHQDYYKKNPLRYKYYRGRCGREKRREALWGERET